MRDEWNKILITQYALRILMTFTRISPNPGIPLKPDIFEGSKSSLILGVYPAMLFMNPIPEAFWPPGPKAVLITPGITSSVKNALPLIDFFNGFSRITMSPVFIPSFSASFSLNAKTGIEMLLGGKVFYHLPSPLAGEGQGEGRHWLSHNFLIGNC